MSATKSGNHIYITGSGNTLASITADIADTTFIEKTSTSPDIYTVKGNVARYLRIRSGGTLTIGDPEDYSKNETLAFSSSVANNNRFYVDTGGRLEQYGDTMIDFMTGTQRSYYTYIYGALHIRGNDTYKPVWQNYQRIYFYEQQNNDTYANDVWDIDKMIVGSACTANYYSFYLGAFGKVRNHIFKNITWDKTYGKGNQMYALRLPYDVRGIRNITFENLDFNDVGNYPLYSSARVHLKGCTFGTTGSWKVLSYGMGFPVSGDTYRDYGYHGEHEDGQNFMYLEDCTFENQNNKNCLLIQYNSVVLCKDCTWEHDTGDSIQVAYGGVVMMWTGNTFTGGREYYDVDFDGRIQWVYDLTLTITDEEENPVEGATVLIKQSGGKERFTFHTDSDGKMTNDHNLDCALLTHKHQYGNSKTTDAEYWSDSSNSTYHTVTVFKDGYRPYTEDYVMDQTRSDTIRLERIDARSLTF